MHSRHRYIMGKEKKETSIPVQMPAELQEEFTRLKEEWFPEKTEEELYWLAVRIALDSRELYKK